MKGTRVVHLEVHSHYSLMEGLPAVEALAARAAAEGMPALALTDSNALHGAVAFSRACEEAGVKPIVGLAVHVAPPPGLAMPIGAGGESARLILLATGPAGYRSLCRLSRALLDSANGTARRQGLAWEALSAHHEGLLCIDAGQRGWLGRLLAHAQASSRVAGRYLSRLGGLFEGRGYVGLTLSGADGAARAEDVALAREGADLGRRFGLPAVALQPVYCLERADSNVLRLVAAAASGTTVGTVPVEALPGAGLTETWHWLEQGALAERFAAFPEALAETARIAARCAPALPPPRPLWPALDLPREQTPEEALAAAARSGLARRYGARDQATVEKASARLGEELKAIGRHGYAPLFLVVAEIVAYARRRQIPASTRGSVANSLVAYCVGITTVDPIAHNLLFARFLNPARKGLPDIDLDLCSRRRDTVLDYIRRRWGEEHVALVGAMQTMRARTAVRTAAHAHGYGETGVRRVQGMLGRSRDDGEALRAALAALDAPHNAAPARQLKRDRMVLEAALPLLGLPHHSGVHPGGVVITPGPICDAVPVQWAAKGYLATQYDHRALARVGLPKLDLLGIRALTVLADAAALVRAHGDPEFRVDSIPTDDAATAALLSTAETIGVFQCESVGARRTLRQLRAQSVGDLAVANAFFKPGPAMGGMAETFVRRYRGEEQTEPWRHPVLADILGPTHGVLIFQEQVLRLAREVAGLSWAAAEVLRRGMSRMEPRAMAALRVQFVDGCQAPPEGPGLGAAEATALWEQVAAFAGYGFNQGHATAYADVSYRSAYLKAHWPAAFLCARLADGGGFYPSAVYVAEAVRLGIEVRPPHIDHSARRWTLGHEAGEPVLWMGLGAVRGLRRRSIAALVAARQEAPFAGLRDLLSRVPDLRQKEVANLIRGGALDSTEHSRAALLAEAETLQRAGSAHQMTFAFAAAPEVPTESATERLQWEQQVLGQPISVHPLDLVPTVGMAPLRRLAETRGRALEAAGVRLPGRTGDSGFYLWDGDCFVLVRGSRRPRAWAPLAVRGRWREGHWGGGWLEAETVRFLS